MKELHSQISASLIEHVIHTNVYREVVFLGSIVLHYILMDTFYIMKSVGVCMISVLAQFSIRYISGIIGHKEGCNTIYHTLHRSVKKPVLQSKPLPNSEDLPQETYLNAPAVYFMYYTNIYK